MTKRAWALLLALGLSVSIQGCGDDDSGDDEGDDGSSNAGSGNAGRSGSGSGSSGNGSSGSGSGNAGSGNPDDAIAECMAQEMMGGGSTADCEGIEEYSECVQDMCSVQDCMDNGCEAYFDCVEDAEDPCMPTGCTPTSDCTACLLDVGTCSADNCFDLIMCGEVTAGGACDQLDDCCDAQPESMRMVCEQAASGSRAAGGDELCMTVMQAFCM